jgi:CRISPR-associated helicase Cas3/CRISPR-associated endonuclease Cas3-HD
MNYAHSKKDTAREKWHLLRDHLLSVGSMAGEFAKPFNSDQWANICGVLHDIGKYSKEFQNYICTINENPSQKKVDHSSAGAQLVNELSNGKGPGKILAALIAGHHAGLPDFYSPSNSSLSARLKKTIPDYSDTDTDILNQNITKLTLPTKIINKPIDLFIWMKMLYSCLVDADFLDTEKFMSPQRANTRNQDVHITEELLSKFNKHMEELSSKSESKSEINNTSVVHNHRQSVLKNCVKASELGKGFFSLTAPTGAGKTLSSLSFALNHVVKHSMDRIIYAIPFTSIIDQNAKVFREVLGKEYIIEHHCNYDSMKDDIEDTGTENWDMPIIVTTNVQFFESLFSNRSSRCRKLHNIINSVIILDEAQALPRHILLPTLDALKVLVEHYNCTIVLCTATQPALVKRPSFENGIENVHEIIKDPEHLYNSLRRTIFSNFGKLTHETLVSKISEHKQSLTVVNTRKYARHLYESLKADQPGGTYFHLSTLMCPVTRSKVLEQVHEKLDNGEECTVISTSLIEAGVDIDFPVVFRHMAGLDSIIQSGGRCNREGKLDQGNVFVFVLDSLDKNKQLEVQSTTYMEIIKNLKENKEMDSLSTIYKYFSRILWKAGDALDVKGICKLIEAGKYGEFPFKEISDCYKLIDTITIPIIIPLTNEIQNLISGLEIGFISRSISRKLQKYSVSVYPYEFKELQSVGAINCIDDKYNVLVRQDFYSAEIGLLIRKEEPLLCV